METKSGCLLIYKERGMTSRDVDCLVGKRLNVKKVGHLGTLDPFAEGLLIVMVNNGTKVSQFLENADKTYKATLKFGEKTDTGDLTGNIIEKCKIKNLTQDLIDKTLISFLGNTTQIPPMYSAIKKNGIPLYKLARKGQIVTRKARNIYVKMIYPISFDGTNLTFLATVSKGTYIRTLGEDIAKKMGVVGHLIELERVCVGDFQIKDAKKVSEIEPKDIIPIEKMLSFIPSAKAEGALLKKIVNGAPINLECDKPRLKFVDEKGIIAIYKKDIRVDKKTFTYISERGFR